MHPTGPLLAPHPLQGMTATPTTVKLPQHCAMLTMQVNTLVNTMPPRWSAATASMVLHHPINNKQANCLTVNPASLEGKTNRYWDWLASVNDGGSLFGGGRCTPRSCMAGYPTCEEQQVRVF